MSRTALAVVSLVALVACKPPKGVQVDARELVPSDASGAFGFELEPVRTSPIGPLLHDGMESDSDMKAMLAAVPECNLDLPHLRGMMAGIFEGDERIVAVVEAPKIGDEDTVRCIEKGFARAQGRSDAGLILFDTRGDVRTLDQEGGGKLVILNENALAFVDAPWEQQFFASLENPASRNTTTPLAKAVAKIDPGTDAWFSLALTDAQRAELGDLQGGDGIATATMLADLGNGLKLDIAMDARDEANAKQLETSIRTLLDEVKPGLAAQGFPAGMLDKTKVSAAESRVTATIEVGSDALPGLLGAFVPMMSQ
jgi:hypothetical protein